ncbi:MAG: hypothetical protein K8S27_04430 [Candidatus Omnitrophica bacterium]|nr:hypothetical protein [Candidatus Omnitrophota bacterium]
MRITGLFLITLALFLSGPFNLIVAAAPSIVAVETDANGNWQLIVDQKPYFIKGVIFSPVKIGEDPKQATMRDWMFYDDDNDGKNDIAYQTWIDLNKDGRRDPDEKIVGDFQLLKEMGVNTIRLYHLASDHASLGDVYKKDPGTKKQYDHAVNKSLLRELNDTYGIKVILGHFLGSWTIGSGATWNEGTDYNNSLHRENIKKSVKAMVLDHKDESYVLFWALGNENNMADWSKCNAKQYPAVYAKFVNELARMVHELDPHHPVAVIDGEDGYATLKQYARHGQDIDIIGYNTYRGEVGLQFLLKDVRSIWDKPLYISEIGKYAYGKNGEDEDLQFQFIKGSWRTIVRANAQYSNPDLAVHGTGQVIGVTFFDWLDRWYMDGTPAEHSAGTRTWPGSQQFIHEEWFGVMSMGDGSDSLMRQRRKSYDYLKRVWTHSDLIF